MTENPGIDLNITFIYFDDLPRAMEFYGSRLGLSLAIDQGWCKIYQASGSGLIGLVDGKRGYHKPSSSKPIMLCFRVQDLDAWYAFVQQQGIIPLHEPRASAELGIRAFLFLDPEGHTIEVQTPLQ